MTSDDAGPTHLDDIARVHEVLVEHLEAMAADGSVDAATPSVLPGWTQGHVLTHIARNADSFIGMLTAAERGESLAQYPGGWEQRNGDIEAGAARPWGELVEDVRSSAATLEAAFADHTRWDVAGVALNGGRFPVEEIPFRRWREVLIHHTDLGDPGFASQDWPVDYVREELGRQTMAWNARQPMGATGLPAAALGAPELARLLWLLGRTELDGLGPAGVF